MKGILVSLIMLAAYVLGVIVLAHLFKPKRHTTIFFPLLLASLPAYFGVYALLPADLGFLSAAWMGSPGWLDALVGAGVLVLNVHSFIDYFFGFNGGFSTSMMLMIYRAGTEGLTAREITAGYTAPDGTDKIMGWRVPKLQEDGYVTVEPDTGRCDLTPKGLAVARLADFLKRCLNLGAGG